MFAPAGGSQAVAGYLGASTWGAYDPYSLFDMIVESFSGTHDFIGGQLPGFYDAEGNTTRGRSDLTSAAADISAAVAIPLSAPFALSELLSPTMLQIIFAVKP
jgi:filamentous hemagglutinin